MRHLNNGTDHRHSKSRCDQSSPARRTTRTYSVFYFHCQQKIYIHIMPWHMRCILAPFFVKPLNKYLERDIQKCVFAFVPLLSSLLGVAADQQVCFGPCEHRDRESHFTLIDCFTVLACWPQDRQGPGGMKPLVWNMVCDCLIVWLIMIDWGYLQFQCIPCELQCVVDSRDRQRSHLFFKPLTVPFAKP